MSWHTAMQEFHEHTKGLDLSSATGEELVDAISSLYTRDAIYRLAEEYVGHQADLVGDEWPSSCFAWQGSKDGLMGMMFECLLDEIGHFTSGSPYAAHVRRLRWGSRRKLMERYGFDASSVPPVLVIREYLGLMIQARNVQRKGPGCFRVSLGAAGPEYIASPATTQLWERINKLVDLCDKPEGAATLDRAKIVEAVEVWP